MVLLLVIWSCRRKPAQTAEDNLIAGNVLPYNEEGGGEEDQQHYNIGPLRKPVIPTVDEHHLGTAIVGKPTKRSLLRPEGTQGVSKKF